MPDWTAVAGADELAEGRMVGATVDDTEVLVTKVGGEFRAIGAECTHAGCSLVEDGEIEDGTIMCNCHGSVFDLATGEAVGPPADEPVPVCEVRIEGDEVQVASRG